MKNYLARHLQVLFSACGQLLASPLASLMTIVMLGITLAMPFGLYVVLSSVEKLSGGWKQNAHISVYINNQIDPQRLEEISQQLRNKEWVAELSYQSPEESLGIVQNAV